MASYALTCCSTADLTHEHFAARDIQYVCFHFTLNGETYPDDLGQSIPFPIFYQAMANGAETSTSQVNISEYLDFFTPILESGKDILHVCLSSGLSGSYNSASSAALIAREQFPDRKIYIVDSLGASSGYGLIMETLADLRDEGMDIDTLHQWIEENKLRMNHWFFSTDLTFYVKGGRVSKAAGFIGGVLGICPLLNMDEQGHLIPRAKIRSKKKVIQEMLTRMEQYADNGLDYGFHAAIEAQDNKQSRKEIHPRPGGKDQQLRPKALVFQGPGIAGGLVLPLHGAEAAEGKAPQGVQGLPLLLLANGRAHADGELIHPHAAGLGGHKMSQLVYGDEHTEHQHRN
mgnify:CR=1 FL=1